MMRDNNYGVLRRVKPWKNAYYYQKADTLYQMTYVFCSRYLISHRDRTVDQMVMAARCCKQNIVEGTEDGETSTEMHIKLFNVARGSLQELRQDYYDYLMTRGLPIWEKTHTRYQSMLDCCRKHNKPEDYSPFFSKWTDEEMANTALTLCHMVDTMLNHELQRLEQEFVTKGGIKERMHAARTGYRKDQDEKFHALTAQVTALQNEILRLKALLDKNKIDY